ncbi:MAG: TerD family protein [Rhodospirillales bacterium]|nr:TerD family protein [Rhodospirillales bacterium]
MSDNDLNQDKPDEDDFTPLSEDDHLKPIDFGMPEPKPEEHQSPSAAPVAPAPEEDTALEFSEEALHHTYDDSANFVEVGDYIDLTEKITGLREIKIGAGWDQKAFEDVKVDVDISCFLLNKAEQTRENEDFVFYNNMAGCAGAVRLQEDSRTGAGDGDDETMTLDLTGIPFDIIKVVFVLSIYDPELIGHHFGMVRNIYLRFINILDNHEIFRYSVDEASIIEQNAVVLATLVREGPKWFVEIQNKPVPGGLGAIAQQYGLLIAEQTG